MKLDVARETALRVLYDVHEKGAYPNIALKQYLEDERLRDLDRAFVTELVYGTVKWTLTIDWHIRQFSKVRLKKISPWILNIIRLGIYQLLYMDKIPVSAACNESVNLAKKYGHAATSGFVNGILRTVARNREALEYPDRQADRVEYLVVRYSHPRWMVEQWLARYGEEFTESLLQANNSIADLTVRVNRLKTDAGTLAEKLQKEGVAVRPARYMEIALVLEQTSSIARLEAFREGLFQVQDESSMLVGRVLNPMAGQLVVDVCSAPGGKATHAAELMDNVGTVLARDIHPHKIHLIEEAAHRLGISIIQAAQQDAVQADPMLTGKADRVLVDAPCTGLGIIRRKPDIKWTRKPEDKKDIMALQKTILETAATYVKPGGELVYSTCTIEPEENEMLFLQFLEEHPAFAPVDITPLLPQPLQLESAHKGYIQLYPNVQGMDGFFISKMKKRSM